MRVGDLGGLNDIYDESGHLILKDRERLLLKSEDANMAIWRGKRGLTSRTMLARTKEGGKMFLTDKRLVFIRSPDPGLYFKTYSTPFALPEGISGAVYAKNLKKLGLRIFAEISYGEVKTFKSHRNGKWIRLWMEDNDGTPIQAYFERQNKHDNRVNLLEGLLLRAGATKIN